MGCPGGGSEKGNGNRILSERDVCSAGRGSRSVVLEASPVLLSEIMENGIRLFRTRFPAGMPVRFPVHDAGGLPGAGGCPDSAGACSSSPDAGSRRIFLLVFHLPVLGAVAGVADRPSIFCLVLEKAP